ncbi:hypothetical protein QBC37DRAFT_485574 [Rhypophila decipiens]|uniref:Uncharacterized protein n=1 Tax=Rhypophila decipiens TaxID=261697 RepID=A0AAN7B6S5_9PEZI|nr:hypothetical protein QBC37DRAFT_485574 [Rhypophila decipiens]
MNTPKKAGNKRPAVEALENALSPLPANRATTGDTRIKLVILTSDVLLDGRRAVVTTIRKLFATQGLQPAVSDVEILAAFAKGPRFMIEIFGEIGLLPQSTQPAGPGQSLITSTPRKKLPDSSPRAPSSALPSTSFHVKHTPTGRIPSTSPTAQRKSIADLSPVAARQNQASRLAGSSATQLLLAEQYNELIVQEPFRLYNGVKEMLARLHGDGVYVLVLTQHPTTVWTKSKMEKIPQDHIEAILDCMHDFSKDSTKFRRFYSNNIAPSFGLSPLPGDVNIKKEKNGEDDDEDMEDALPPLTPSKGKAIVDHVPTTPRSDPRSQATTSSGPSVKVTPSKSNHSESKGQRKQVEVEPQTPSRKNKAPSAPGATPTKPQAPTPTKPQAPTPTNPQAPTPTKPAPPAPGPSPTPHHHAMAAQVGQLQSPQPIWAKASNRSSIKGEEGSKTDDCHPEVLFVSCSPTLCASMGKTICARTCWVNQMTGKASVPAGIDPAQFDYIVGDLFQLADSILGKEEKQHVDAMDVDISVQADHGCSAVEMVLPGSSSEAKGQEEEEHDMDEDGDGMGDLGSTATAVAVATPVYASAAAVATPTAAAITVPLLTQASVHTAATAVPASGTNKKDYDSDDWDDIIVCDPKNW